MGCALYRGVRGNQQSKNTHRKFEIACLKRTQNSKGVAHVTRTQFTLNSYFPPNQSMTVTSMALMGWLPQIPIHETTN